MKAIATSSFLGLAILLSFGSAAHASEVTGTLSTEVTATTTEPAPSQTTTISHHHGGGGGGGGGSRVPSVTSGQVLGAATINISSMTTMQVLQLIALLTAEVQALQAQLNALNGY
jgi:hypothetical protein